MGVTVENVFISGCTFLKYASVMGGCGCLGLLNAHLWMVVLFLNLLMGGCRCL